MVVQHPNPPPKLLHPVPPVSDDPLVVFTTGVADRLLRVLYRNDSDGVWNRGTLNSTAGLAHALATEMQRDGWTKLKPCNCEVS